MTNKILNVLTDIINIMRYIYKYQFSYSKAFMHTDGQTVSILIGFPQVCNHI